jgi:hypothetical protein
MNQFLFAIALVLEFKLLHDLERSNREQCDGEEQDEEDVAPLRADFVIW